MKDQTLYFWLITGLLVLITVLVFLVVALDRKKYPFLKQLLYLVFVVIWVIVFIYLVVRVGAMILYYVFYLFQ